MAVSETWKMEEFLALTKEHSLVKKGRALGATGYVLLLHCFNPNPILAIFFLVHEVGQLFIGSENSSEITNMRIRMPNVVRISLLCKKTYVPLYSGLMWST